jgi:hypothetical protein
LPAHSGAHPELLALDEDVAVELVAAPPPLEDADAELDVAVVAACVVVVPAPPVPAPVELPEGLGTQTPSRQTVAPEQSRLCWHCPVVPVEPPLPPHPNARSKATPATAAHVNGPRFDDFMTNNPESRGAEPAVTARERAVPTVLVVRRAALSAGEPGRPTSS